jgi:hypothetical protein
MDDALTEGKRSVKRFIHISDETFVGKLRGPPQGRVEAGQLGARPDSVWTA